MMSDEKALLYAYCAAIFYGIVKNFHLLENFTSDNKTNNTLVPGGKLNIKGLFNAHNNNENIVKMALKKRFNKDASDDKVNSENSLENSSENMDESSEEIFPGVPTPQTSIMKKKKQKIRLIKLQPMQLPIWMKLFQKI